LNIDDFITRWQQSGGTVQPLLESLSALGQARPTEGGRFAA